MSTITKERLKELAAGQSGFNLRTATPEESMELARIALASLEAEKARKHHSVIAEQLAHVLSGLDATDHQRAVISCAIDRLNNVAEILQRPPSALTTPPALVSVPDEAMPENIAILASTYAPRGVTYQWDRDECNAAADSWNACRAAMLQGAENAESRCTIKTAPALDSLTKNAESRCGNSPVIPEGWVLVPEEPTHEMLEAGDEQFGTYDVYRRMIEAAPKLE